MQGDLEKLGELISTLEIRKLPYSQSLNSQTRFPELQKLEQDFHWPVLLSMIVGNGTSEERSLKMSNIFRQMASTTDRFSHKLRLKVS